MSETNLNLLHSQPSFRSKSKKGVSGGSVKASVASNRSSIHRSGHSRGAMNNNQKTDLTMSMFHE